MPNTEWWDNEKYRLGEPGYRDWDIPLVLTHHREMIVKEIREEILRVWDKPLTSEDSYGFATAGKALALNDVLSLPCLKENE